MTKIEAEVIQVPPVVPFVFVMVRVTPDDAKKLSPGKKVTMEVLDVIS